MKRYNAYFGQLVTEADVDDWFDAAEQALWDLAVDIGLEGVIEGAVLTETSTPSMYIEASSGCRAYDQAGQRIYFGPVQTIDCSQDELGNPTIPSAGKERVIMIELKFKRLLSDLRTDDNGASVYYLRSESFEINVVAGAEVTAPASYPGDAPTAPSDALILGDIVLTDSTTVINTSDIKLDRRQDFIWTDADKIGVSAGSWNNIDSTSDHVQDALDSVDNELIAREVDGDIDQHLLPKDSTYDLGAAANVWGEVHGTDFTVYNTLKASADQKVLGTAVERFTAHLYDTTVYNQVIPDATGKALGSSGAQFDAHLRNATIYNALKASADGKAFGDATFRFVPHLKTVLLYDATVANALKFSAAKSVTVMVPVTDFVELVASTWAWDATASWLECTSLGRVVHIHFRPLHGATIQSMRVRWAQASGTGMTAQIESFDEDNSPTSVGSSKTITTIDGTTNWDTIDTSLAEVVDLSTTGYRVKITTNASVTHEVYMLEVTYDVTDALLAALARA